MITIARGTSVEQSYQSETYDTQVPGTTLNLITAVEQLSGDIQATQAVRFLQLKHQDGSATFWGLGRLIGSIGAKHGSFVMHDHGTIKDEVVSGTWAAVDGTGTDDFAGLSGSGTFRAEQGKPAHWHFEYTIDAEA